MVAAYASVNTNIARAWDLRIVARNQIKDRHGWNFVLTRLP